MKLHIIAVGTKMPNWVQQAYQDYAKRLPNNYLNLIEIPVSKKKQTQAIITEESQQMIQRIPKNAMIIALEVKGKSWNTETLAQQLQDWQRQGNDIALLIGGANGLAQSCRDQADYLWSLSTLTLPHGLVRVILVEQIYRAWSLNHNHPYHRA